MQAIPGSKLLSASRGVHVLRTVLLLQDDYVSGLRDCDPSPEEQERVIAFLVEEARRDPPRLDFEGFQELVRAFSQLAGISAEKASAHSSCKPDKLHYHRGT